MIHHLSSLASHCAAGYASTQLMLLGFGLGLTVGAAISFTLCIILYVRKH